MVIKMTIVDTLILNLACNEILKSHTHEKCVFAYSKALQQAVSSRWPYSEKIKLAKAYLEKQLELIKTGKIIIFKKQKKKNVKSHS